MKRLLSVLTAFLLAACFYVMPASAAEQKWQYVKLDEKNITIGVPAGWAVLYKDMSKNAKALKKLKMSEKTAKESFYNDSVKLLFINPDKTIVLSFNYVTSNQAKSLWSFRNATDTEISMFEKNATISTKYKNIQKSRGKIGECPVVIETTKDNSEKYNIKVALTLENGGLYSFYCLFCKRDLTASDKALFNDILSHTSITLLPENADAASGEDASDPLASSGDSGFGSSETDTAAADVTSSGYYADPYANTAPHELSLFEYMLIYKKEFAVGAVVLILILIGIFLAVRDHKRKMAGGLDSLPSYPGKDQPPKNGYCQPYKDDISEDKKE